MRLGRYGELLPERGFSRWPVPASFHVLERGSVWRSHDGLMVISTLEQEPAAER